MKKKGMIISVLMGFVMSLSLSLTGNLLSGHFTIGGFLLSFAVSFVISLIIGFLVPMKPLGDKACRKCNIQPETFKANLLTSLISDLIYTPLMTLLMVLLMTNLSAVQIRHQIAELDTQITQLQQQIESIPPEQIEKIQEMQGGIVQMQTRQSQMQSAIPEFLPSFLPSLLVCMVVGYILIMIFQPIFVKMIMKPQIPQQTPPEE